MHFGWLVGWLVVCLFILYAEGEGREGEEMEFNNKIDLFTYTCMLSTAEEERNNKQMTNNRQ